MDLAKRFFRRYFIEAMAAMAQGLFASLLIGIILAQLFRFVTWEPLQPIINIITKTTAANSPVIGAVIGVAIAYALKSKPLVLYSCIVVGAMGYTVTVGGVMAGPVGAYLAVCVAATIGNIIAGKTPLDILLIPTVCLVSGSFIAVLVGPAIATFMRSLGSLINNATNLQPFWMGLVVSVLMSLILFSPLSSAAMGIMLGLSGLAAGAATAGCAASMIGFAATSWRDNKIGGILAQALGTSMLQIGNTLAHPTILIPSTLAAAIAGPLATLVFGMTNIAVGSGMGTSGLVGSLTTFSTMAAFENSSTVLLKIGVLHFLIPAVISFACYELLLRAKVIKKGWLAL